MATISVRRMEVHEFPGGNGYAWDEKEAATQTFLLGALLVYSAGYVQESGADPADRTVAGVANRAGQNGTAAGDKTAEFTPLFPGTLIEANLCAGASANTKTLAQTDIGTAYGLIKRTVSGLTHWVIDSTDTTNTMVRVVQLRDAVADTNGRVIAAVLGAKCAFGG